MFNHDMFQSRMSAVMQALAEAVLTEMKRLLDECSTKTVGRCEALTTHINEEEHDTTLDGAQQFNKTMTNQFALIMETLTQAAVDKMTVLLKRSMAELKSTGSAKQWTREKDETTQKRLRSGPRRPEDAKTCLPPEGSSQLRETNKPSNKEGIEQADQPPQVDNTEMSTPTENSQTTPIHTVSEHVEEDNIQEANSSSISATAATSASKLKKKVAAAPIKCPACDKTFALQCFFHRHYLSHSKPHACSQCDKRFARPDGLAAHARRHTGEKPFSCAQCETQFAYKSAFNRHVRQQHAGERSPGAPGRTLACVHCERHFPGARPLQRHKCPALAGPFPCSVCPETFRCRLRLAAHESLHSARRDFVCETCGELFISSASLSAHRVTHTAAAACCDELGVGCSDARVLRHHLSRHGGEKPYACGLCGKGCSHASALKHHMLAHTGEKPLACEACGKRCGHASALQNHMRTHTGQKAGTPPLCPVCGKRLSSMVKLRYHMSVHTGERPYGCQRCDRRFSNPSNLRAHAAVHTGDKLYGCTVCGRRFTQATSLRQHRLVHTGERPHRCGACGKGFTHRAGLRKHQLVHTQARAEEDTV